MTDTDREIKALISKIVAGTATPEDRYRYQEMSVRRYLQMQPRAPRAFESARERRLGKNASRN